MSNNNNNNNNNNSTTMIVLEVTGMMCQKNCGSTVQQALLNVHGVTHVQVSFPHSRAIVVGTHNMSASDAIDAVECVGFDARYLPNEDGPKWLQQLQTETSKQQQQSSPTSVLELHHHDTDTDDDVSQDEQHTIMLQVLGMSCAVCVGRVERVLLGVEGVQSAKVVLATNRAQVTLDPYINDKDDIAQQCVEAVHQDGYDCRTIQTKGLSLHENAAQMQQARHQELQHWKCLLLVALLFTIPIMVLHYSKTTILQSKQHYIIWKQVLMGVLATVVQICVGKRYYQAAYKAWPTMGMDSLIVMGTTASYVYSVVTLFILLTIQEATSTETTLEPTFETGAMLLSFVTFGKYLEAYAKGKTASALQHLMELQPVVALKVVNHDESLDYPQETIASLQTQQVDVSQLQVGEVVMVMPGARIPADGVLKSCNNNSKSCFIDESALSGEPFPVCKQVGEPVYGATVNQLSVALVQITATGSQTVLAKICHLVEQAQTNKAPIQTKADQIANTFCPTVLILAFLTFAGWIIYGITFSGQSWQHVMVGALTSSIAVVVVACPCALGLATPTAVMVGTGVGATHGLLIKGGAVLECAHQASTIVLDKTGTLTTGRAVLGHVQPIDTTTTMTLPNHLPPTTTMTTQKDAVLWLAACAESQSEHPLAKAICNAATATWGNDYTTSWFQSHGGTQVSQNQIVPGSGVECLISSNSKENWNCRVRVGNKAFVQCTSAEADEALLKLRQAGQVGVYVSVHTNNDSTTWKVVGVLGIVDPIVPEAKSTVAALQQQMGLDVWMCTGDHEVTALGVAHQVGIDPDNVVAGVSPEEKADLVSRLGDRVVFVGDGINDAIALARAHVGVAIGAGTEIAVEAADMVLVKSCLHDVVVALHLSRVVFDRIRLNFVWAMGYNLVALPFAAGILVPVLGWRLPPEFAGLMMAFSSVSVVTSSLLLRLYSKPTISQEGKLQVHGCLARLCTCQSALCGGVWSNCLCGPCNYCIAKICSCSCRRQGGGRRMRRVARSEMEYDSDCMDEMTSLDEHVEIV